MFGVLLHCLLCCTVDRATHGLPAVRAPVYRGCPCRDPLGCPPIPRQDGIGDKAPTLWLLLLTVLHAEAELMYYRNHIPGRSHVSWASADFGGTCSCVQHARELSSFCTTFTTSGKLFDTTSTGKIPGCSHSISHISQVVKVSKLIHLQTVREILRLHVQPFTTAFYIRDISHVRS